MIELEGRVLPTGTAIAPALLAGAVPIVFGATGQGVAATGELAPGGTQVFRVDSRSQAVLTARIEAVPIEARLSLLDGEGRTLVQSDGGSSANAAPLIVQQIPQGTYFLEVQDLGGVGGFLLATGLSASPMSSRAASGASSPLAPGDFNGDGTIDLVAADGVHLGTDDGTFQAPVPGGTFSFGGSAPSAIVTGDFAGNGRLDVAAIVAATGEVFVFMGNGDGTFQPPAVYPTGADPQALVTGDFNGDGRVDLAVADHGSGDVSVLMGNGDGTFRAPLRFAAGSGPSALVAGDFNGDGTLDLAVADQGSGSVSVLLGSGDGTFQDPVSYASGLGPSSLVAGDFGGDGTLDLAVANQGSNTIAILNGHGDGTFQDPTLYATGSNPVSLVAGDFSGEGTLDLAVADRGSDDISLFLNRGDGTFQARLSLATGPGPVALTAADFRGDGRLDLAYSYAGGLASLQDLGNGQFQDPNPPGPTTPPDALALADFNGDGQLDLAATNPTTNDVSVLLGNGDGTFQAPMTYPTGINPVAVAVGDFNGDGRLDLAVADQGSDDVSVLLGRGDGTFQDALTFATDAPPVALIAKDLVGHGRLDLVVATTAGIEVLMGNGDGTFRRVGTEAPGTQPVSLVAGDFTGDGHVDLAFVDAGTRQIDLLTGLGNGTFLAPVAIATEGPSASPLLLTGDFNGDGHPDLAYPDGGGLTVLEGAGGGVFGAPVHSASGGLSGATSAAVVANFNGGPADVAMAAPGSGGISVFFGAGDGTFGAPVLIGAGPSGNATSLAAGDLTGNGRPDLVGVGAGLDGLAVQLDLGHGKFAAPGPYNTTRHATPLVVDVSGDGTTDLVVVNSAGEILWRRGKPGNPTSFAPPVVVNPGDPSRAVAFVTNGGDRILASVDARDNAVSLFAYRDGGFVAIGSLATGSLPIQIAAADLAGDGFEDLAVLNAGDGSVSIFLNTGNGFVKRPDIPIGTGASSLGLVDVDGDGTADLLVTDDQSGEISVLINQGGAEFAPATVYRAGTGTSRIDDSSGTPVITSEDQASGVAVGTFVRGGPPGLVTIDPGTSSFSVLEGLGDGRFANPASFPTSGPARAVSVGDFNGDGVSDVAILGANGVSVYLGDGKGGFLPSTTYAAGLGPTGLSVAKLDGDGNLDLVVGNRFGDVLVLHGRGDGTFRPYRRTDRNVALAVADLQGNGSRDFIFANQALDRVVVDYGGTKKAVLGNQASGLLSPGAVTLADLNGDGILDLIVANSGSNNVLVYPGLGNGQFGRALNAGRGFFAGTNPVGITVADVNGDGRPDLVIANQGSNDVTILLNKKQANGFTFVPGPRLKAGAGPTASVVRDVNGDGIPDLLISDSGSNSVRLLPGLGHGFFNDRNPTIYAVGDSPGPLFVGQFDGQPGLDLVTVNSGSNDLTMISNFAQGSGVAQTIGSGGTDPVAAFAVQLPGSSTESLVVANNEDGHLALLLGGADGLTLETTLVQPGLPNPTTLALPTIVGDTLEFYATTEGKEQATLVTFSLGGGSAALFSLSAPAANGAGPLVQLVPLRDSALALVGTLLTLSLESPAGESGEGVGVAAPIATPLPQTSATMGQGLPLREEEVASEAETPEGQPVILVGPGLQGAFSWERFVLGVDEGLEAVGHEARGQLLNGVAPPQAIPQDEPGGAAVPESLGSPGLDPPRPSPSPVVSQALPRAGRARLFDQAIEILDSRRVPAPSPAPRTAPAPQPPGREGPAPSPSSESRTPAPSPLLVASFAAIRISPRRRRPRDPSRVEDRADDQGRSRPAPKRKVLW